MSEQSFVSQVSPLFGASFINDFISNSNFTNDESTLLKMQTLIKVASQSVSGLYKRLIEEHCKLLDDEEELLSFLLLDTLVVTSGQHFEDLLLLAWNNYVVLNQSTPSTVHKGPLATRFASYLVAKFVKENANEQVCQNILLDIQQKLQEFNTTIVLGDTELHHMEQELLDQILTFIDIIASLLSNHVEGLKQFETQIFDLLMQGVRAWPSAHRKQIIMNLLPPLIKFDPSPQKLNALWDTVQSMFNAGAETRMECYSLLCQFFEQFFALNGNAFAMDLRGQEMFWNIILTGLASEDTFTRKRSIYLQKRIVDLSKSNPTIKPETWTKYFEWSLEQAKDLNRQWDLFFMLYDTLDQYSSHLLHSTWGQIFNMFPKRGDKCVYLNFEWVKLLLVAAFTHNNFGVCKMTIASFFDLDLSVYDIYFDMKFVTETIFEFIGNSKFFYKKEKIGSRMVKFFGDYYNSLSHQDVVLALKNTLRCLTKNEASRTIPSYFLASMTQITQASVLDNECIDYLTNIYDEQFRDETAWVQFRGYSLIIEVLCRLSDPKQLDQSSLSKFLVLADTQMLTPQVVNTITSWLALRGEEQLVQDLSELLAEALSRETLTITTSYVQRFARLLALSPIQATNVHKMLQPIYDKLHTIYSHYQEELTPFKILLFITTILSELRQAQLGYEVCLKISQDLEELTSFIILKLRFPEIEQLTKESALSFQESMNIIGPLATQLNYYVPASEQVQKLNHHIMTISIDFIQKVTETKSNLMNSGYETNVLSNCAYDLIHSLITPLLSNKGKGMTSEMCVSLLKTNFAGHTFTSRVKTDDSYDGNGTIRPASMVLRDTFEAKWRNINELLHIGMTNNLLENESELLVDLLSEASDILGTLSSNNMIIGIDCIRYLLPTALEKGWIDEDKAEQYIDAIFDAMRGDRHRNEAICYATFTCLIMRPAVLRKLSHVTNAYIDKLLKLSEVAQRLVLALAYEISNNLIGNDEDIKISLVDQIVKVICFVPTIYEDDDYDSFEYATSTTAYSLSDETYPATIRFERLTRALLFSALTKQQNQLRFVEALTGRLVKRLFDKDMNKLPCMPNSVQHKSKLRMWQTLIILVQYMNEKIFNNLNLKQVVWQLLNLANMSTVRRLMEVYSILICFKFPHEMSQSLKTRLGADYNGRAQYLSSLVAVAGNFVLFAPDEDFPRLTKLLLPYIVMYSTMHQYAVRIMGHIMYVQIWTRLNSLHNRSEINGFGDEDMWKVQLDQLQELYMKSDSSIQYFEKYRDMVMIKITEIAQPINLFGQPYIEGTNVVNDHIPMPAFHLVHKHFEAMLFSLYNLNGKMIETWKFRVDSILHSSDTGNDWEQTFNSDNEESDSIASLNPLKDTAVAQVHIDTKDLPQVFKSQQPVEEEETIVNDDKVINFQRKIVPWSALELENEINPRLKRASKERQPVIVMASLIDKLPNLAGLSRTCEIFQAEKLVVSNAKVTEHDEFQAISVTSERWLPIEECKEADIMDYLRQKKQEGYSILGVEQTSSSVSIEKFTFPRKCVLVLGKEKEGIPSELINMIDTCVEIPQLGMVRSLNVHVTGSIMMFEYTRQHQIASTTSE